MTAADRDLSEAGTLDEAGTGAQDATHETFAQLDELLAELSAG